MELTINTTAAQVKVTGMLPAEKAEKTEKVQAQDNAAADSAEQAHRFDTVELSTEAEQYLEEDSAQDVEYCTTTTDSSDSTDALYTYTDDELADLLRSGDITQTQYNTEMAKRGVSAE